MLLDQDMFSLSETAPSTYNTYPSDNNSYYSPISDDHIVSNVNLLNCIDQRDNTERFFENSGLMSNMKIYFDNNQNLQNDDTITINYPDYHNYSNHDMQGKNLNIIPNFEIFMSPQDNISYSIDDSQKIFSLDFDSNY